WISFKSILAAPGRAWKMAPLFSIRARWAEAERKTASWPPSTKNVAIAIRGLRWPVAGVEAIRIFMKLSIHRAPAPIGEPMRGIEAMGPKLQSGYKSAA